MLYDVPEPMLEEIKTIPVGRFGDATQIGHHKLFN